MRSAQLSLAASAILAGVLCAPSLAAGQPPNRSLRLGGILSGSIANGGAAPAVSVSVDYRFMPRLGLEVDASYLPKLDVGDFPNCPPGRICVRGGTYSLHARTGSLSASLISELPLGTPRIRPYLAAGGGVAHVRRTRQDNFFSFRSTSSGIGPSISAGGGVEFLAGPRIGVGVDVRYQRIFEKEPNHPFPEPDLDLMRIGCSVSYRF